MSRSEVNASAAEKIPVQKAAIAEPPYSFEDRLLTLRRPARRRSCLAIDETG